MSESCGMINVTDRRKIELTGIKSVDSFDEYTVTLSVEGGKLSVEGEQLNITVLDLDRGVVEAQGVINAVVYSDAPQAKEKGVMSKLFGKKG